MKCELGGYLWDSTIIFHGLYCTKYGDTQVILLATYFIILIPKQRKTLMMEGSVHCFDNFDHVLTQTLNNL